jgi:phosphatidylglycerol:prolipoprotein diacylglycerol transferase
MDALSGPERFWISCAIYSVAYLVGIAVFAFMARRRGTAANDTLFLALAGLGGGVVGAQVTELVLGGEPGKSLLGGIACGYLAVILVKRSLGISRPTGDLFAPAIALGEAIGRFGCLAYGCCEGKITTAAWALREDGAMRYPTELMSAAAAAATFAVLVVLERKRLLPENGLFYVQGVLLCGARFVIEFYRDVSVTAFGLTTAQLACLGGLAFFGARLVVMLRRAVPRTADAHAAAV